MNHLTIILAACLFMLIIFILLYQKKLKKEAAEHEERLKLHFQKMNEEKLRFYTNIAHELKTPLTLILGPIKDISNHPSIPKEVQELVEVADKNAMHLQTLVNQLMDFRKLETGNWTLRIGYDNFSEKVLDIGTNFKERTKNTGVEFIMDVENGIKAFFDGKVIEIILNNLLSNSDKYTKKGSITLFCRKIESNKSMYAEFGVSDTGSGISKKDLAHIFDRYFQGELSQYVEGSGIGLSMVKNLSEIHEMTLSVNSQTGKGSTFSLRMNLDNTYPSAEHLQVSQAEDDADDEKDSYLESIVPKDFELIGSYSENAKPLIVVIDDNADVTSYASRCLSDNYQVITASNGIRGILLVLKLIPDLVICDIMMPFTDGYEVCERLKRDIRSSHIPVILLTAKDSAEDKTQGYDVGADSYITKPFDSNMLKSRVKNLIDGRRKLAGKLVSNNIDKAVQGTEETESQPEILPIDEEFLQDLATYAKEGILSHTLNVGFLSEKMCMSSSSLYRKIKGLLGITINEYIRKMRLKEAAELLKSGRFNVSEAAWQVDLNSLAYFRRCFKEEFGMFPSDYRKEQLSRNKDS